MAGWISCGRSGKGVRRICEGFCFDVPFRPDRTRQRKRTESFEIMGDVTRDRRVQLRFRHQGSNRLSYRCAMTARRRGDGVLDGFSCDKVGGFLIEGEHAKKGGFRRDRPALVRDVPLWSVLSEVRASEKYPMTALGPLFDYANRSPFPWLGTLDTVSSLSEGKNVSVMAQRPKRAALPAAPPHVSFS